MGITKDKTNRQTKGDNGGRSLYLYALRSQIASRWAVLSQLVALFVVAAALFELIEGDIAIGGGLGLIGIGASWLAGLWVVPGGTDAYLRKLAVIMRDAQTDLWFERYKRSEQLRATVAKVASLEPSERDAGTQGRILATMDQVEALIDDRTIPFADRADGIFEQSRLLYEICVALNHQTGPYAELAAEALHEFRGAIVASMEESEELLRRHIDYVTKVRPPQSWRASHHELLSALTDHTTAVGRYYAAAQGDSREEVDKAIACVVATFGVLEGERQKFVSAFRLLSRGDHARKASAPLT